MKVEAEPTIAIVNDDPGTRDLLADLLRRQGFRTQTYADGDAFLALAHTSQPDCVLLDIYMPGRSGLEVLQAIGGASYPAPVVMISARTDVPLVVAAMRAGASDFIEKPFEAKVVVKQVREAIRSSRRPSPPTSHDRRAFPGAEKLTAREMDVLEQIISGATNKTTAQHLGISQRTVETHRAQIMTKLGTRNTAELMCIVLKANE